MSDPLLNVMKIMLLAGLYLFFIRVLWSVYNELRDPRTTVSTVGHATDVRATEAPARRGAPAMAGAGSGLSAAPSAGPGPAPSLSTMVMGQLVVVEPVEHAGMTWPVDGEFTLGRSPENSIQLNDTYVSARHARIFAHNGEFFVEDLGSRNGTLLNENVLNETRRLVVGDRIAVGVTVVEFA